MGYTPQDEAFCRACDRLRQAEKVDVMCTYCHKIVKVDQSVVDKLNETTAFCCSECVKG